MPVFRIEYVGTEVLLITCHLIHADSGRADEPCEHLLHSNKMSVEDVHSVDVDVNYSI